MKKLLNVDEVAELCIMSEDRVYALTREGILPCVRFGRSIRWSNEAIECFIQNGGKAWPGGWRREAS